MTMAEVRAVTPNGLRVVSTFAGCGGSSLGYRMAGYKIALASEFIPAAADTYEANADPATIVDRRDIRKLTAGSILDATGLRYGELDLFDGSPPCASFSMAGKRAALWGAVKSYSDTEQRVDDLFGEYLRLLAELQPLAANAENVPGLTIGVARGFYNEIMEGFDRAGYVASAAILEAEWLGVPQARHRLFFQAIRKDLAAAGLKPAFPEPFGYFYSIRDALPDLDDKDFRWGPAALGDAKNQPINGDVPAPTITASRFEGFVEPRVLARLGAPEPETDIARFAIGEQWEKIGGIGQSEKFFQLVRPEPDKPCPTITATAAQPGAASVVHPIEKRKFSVAELKRLSAFPDDFVLTGSYSQQVERIGRAVVPPVTKALGEVVARKVILPWREMQKRKAA